MIGLRKFLVAMLTQSLIAILISVGKVDGAVGVAVLGGVATAYISLEIYKKKILK